MTERQAKRSVNFVFTTVSKISMTLAVSNSAWVYGRDFLFSGKSAVKDCGVLGEWTAPELTKKEKRAAEKAKKQAEKQAEKERKQAEKQAAKEQKQAEKEAARAKKQAEKQAEKEAKKQAEKEAKKAKKEEKAK